MDKDQIKTKVNEIGHAIDDKVEASAIKHNESKWKVWLKWSVYTVVAIVIAVLVMK
jgi:hypothetical protein